MTKDYAIAQLRHAYKQLIEGKVKDQKQFAEGLIAPAIKAFETDVSEPQNSYTFEEAWALKIAEGYNYGEDALEQVRFGWEMAHKFV